MKPSLTVVIPTLNNIQGLKYLKKYFQKKSFKVVIVDNSKKNFGFAGGVNKGVKNAKTKWLLILNDDVQFTDDDAIFQLINGAEKRKLDALSPTLINQSGVRENIAYKILPHGAISNSDIQKGDYDGLTAACLLIKNSSFKKLKGFDEDFFAYLEDVDLFLRFKKIGYKMGISKIQVFHNHMTTSKTMGNFKAKQDMINWWRLYFKHPDKFKFNLRFLEERLRNLSGFLKATLK
jgi:GT2 family glycosyltransferase